MKKFLVVGIFLLTIVSLTACKKEEEPTTEVDPNYAINETREPTEEEEDDGELIYNPLISENSTEEYDGELVYNPLVPEDSNNNNEENTALESHDQIYNVTPDVYANDIKDMSTISIDGKLIGFPCSYQYITEIFGQLTTVNFNGRLGDTYIPVDETLTSTSFEVYATPTTGTGIIKFTFRSNTPTTITEMTCSEVMVQGGNTNGDQVMTFALPQNLTFGSTFDDLLDVYGATNATHYESSNGSSEYRIRFVFEDLNQCYDFTGHDNGLYIAIINYNYTK